jgi:hypothetical protein
MIFTVVGRTLPCHNVVNVALLSIDPGDRAHDTEGGETPKESSRMTALSLTRRAAVLALSAAAFGGLVPGRVLAAQPSIRVVKDPNCGCCTAWVEILEVDGFSATVDLLDYDALQAHKVASGIPEAMVSCHTAHIDGYVIEGHVPPADIRRLLAERPEAVGLSVPGMPFGSPGMGPESAREAYAVHLIRKDGSTEVFTSYDAA